MRSAQQDRDGIKTISGRFAGNTGNVVAGSDFTVTRVAVGGYTIRLNRVRGLVSFVVAADVGTYFVAIPNTNNLPADTISVSVCVSTTGAAADPNFVHFTAQVLPR